MKTTKDEEGEYVPMKTAEFVHSFDRYVMPFCLCDILVLSASIIKQSYNLNGPHIDIIAYKNKKPGSKLQIYSTGYIGHGFLFCH